MKKYEFFTTKEIKPSGWMRRQLEIQAAGLAGNLDNMWPDVKESAWIGGSREGWERVPYWLDGFIPLAYLLDDEGMKQRAQKYIDAIIERQCEDGWICPCTEEQRATYDIWALFLLSKVLTVYYDCTGDERVPNVLYRAMKNCYELMKNGSIVLRSWGKLRWFEAFIALDRLYMQYGEEWIKELAAMLREQGTDFTTLTELWKRPMNKWTLETHIVNLMMSLKYEAVSHELLGEEYSGKTDELYDILYKYNGTPVDLFTGDECLSGISPVQGTELCAVVEKMYSCEHLFAATGDMKWIDKLEKLAFNALPATISDDMWTHQYVQQSNQINAAKLPGKSFFRTNGNAAHIFGLEPHFGCCTANMGQGWPKFMISSFMKAEDGIISAVTIPGSLETEINGTPFKVELATDFPFRSAFTYTVTAAAAVSAKLYVRVPSYAKNLTVNGKAARAKNGMLVFDRKWNGTEIINIEYGMQPAFKRAPSGMYCAAMGPLVFSLPIDSRWEMKEYVDKKGVERKFPYCDYDVFGTTEWRFGYENTALIPEVREITDIPFSSKNPPIVLKAEVSPINWDYAEGYDSICAPKPISPKATGEKRTVELYPYGAAKLRMTEMPFTVRKK